MRVAVSFTGGKDSSLVVTALQLLSQGGKVPEGLKARVLAEAGIECAGALQVACLVTFAPAGGAASFKAHPLIVIQQQASALGLPHVIKEIAGPSYLDSYQAAIRELTTEHAIDALATGDILDVCDNFMGRAAAGANMKLLRPLWSIPRPELLEYVWELGLQPLITCIDTRKFQRQPHNTVNGSSDGTSTCAAGQDARPQASGEQNSCSSEHSSAAKGVVGQLLGQFLTRDFHQELLLPICHACGVDKCGEWGEYHTMVLDGPTFKSRVVVGWADVNVDSNPSEYVFLTPVEVTLAAK